MEADEKIVDDLMHRVDTCIDEFAAHSYNGHAVGAVLDDAIDSRGKMIRPRLLLICGAFGPKFEENRDKLCELAAMIEMIHMSSLIHDDIVDDGPSRRGKPSIQSKYGKDAAVYAGDFLMGRISYYISKDNLNRSGEIIAKTVEAMCSGEIGQAMCRYKEDVTLAEYMHNIHGKTAALFMAACRIGAMESGCSEELIDKMETFGECLGIMFQLRDDLLDFISSKEDEGKEIHRDFMEGIYTMPVISAMRAEGSEKELLPLIRLNKENGVNKEQIREVERLVAKLGGIEATIREIYDRQIQAEQILMSLLPQNEYVLALLRLIRKLGDI